jgi:hypothetical protein
MAIEIEKDAFQQLLNHYRQIFYVKISEINKWFDYKDKIYGSQKSLTLRTN